MYAVIEVGAKQYSVKKEDIIDVERLTADKGKEISLGKVLLISGDKKLEVGQPYLKEAKVKALVVGHLRGEKTVAFKYRRRKASHTSKGHRQELTRLKIKEITAG
ncbi:MAG: 50S ribosomal protein L21 [Candidatus Omnitrophota bacterium]